MSTPGATGVAAKGTLRVESVALLAMATFPLAAAELCATNVTLKLAVWFVVRVMGKLGPLKEYPGPVAVAWLMVTLPLPVFVITKGLLCELPTSGLPKLKLVGAADNCPDVVADPLDSTPVPAKAMVATSLCVEAADGVEPRKELAGTRETAALTVRFPLRPPLAWGVKTTLEVTL